MRDLLRASLAGRYVASDLDTTRDHSAVLGTRERKRALFRAGRTRRFPGSWKHCSRPRSKKSSQGLSWWHFGPSSTTPSYPWDPSRDERGDTEYWRTYLALEGLPVPDELKYPDVPFGDPKELPGWVDREDESTGDY